MTTIVLRSNTPGGLTNAQVDANFTNLNNDKVEYADCTSINLGNRIVRRDSFGDFAARFVTAESIAVTNITISGDLIVNGTTTTVNSTVVSVDDKNIELGAVTNPSNATADGGGITLKGATDKTFNWSHVTAAWTSSEYLDLAINKAYCINGSQVLSSSALGSSVTSSSLTSVGNITSGSWNASTIGIEYGGTGVTTYSKGDMLYAPSSNTVSKLTIGTEGQILKVVSGVPSWTTLVSGATISDNTVDSGNYNLPFTNSTSGSFTTAYINSSSLYFNPSSGTLNSTSFNSLSDIRFKSDIDKISNALEKVREIVGCTFTITETNERSAGVIAQDVLKVQPEAVGGSEDRLTVSYGALMGLIVEAIKELDSKVSIIQDHLFNK